MPSESSHPAERLDAGRGETSAAKGFAHVRCGGDTSHDQGSLDPDTHRCGLGKPALSRDIASMHAAAGVPAPLRAKCRQNCRHMPAKLRACARSGAGMHAISRIGCTAPSKTPARLACILLGAVPPPPRGGKSWIAGFSQHFACSGGWKSLRRALTCITQTHACRSKALLRSGSDRATHYSIMAGSDD